VWRFVNSAQEHAVVALVIEADVRVASSLWSRMLVLWADDGIAAEVGKHYEWIVSPNVSWRRML
jgi:hypothetical protein